MYYSTTCFQFSLARCRAPPSPFPMAAANHCLLPPLSPCPLVSISLSLPAHPRCRCLRRRRPPFASWRTPVSSPPASPPPLLKKCVSGSNHGAVEEDGAVTDEYAEAEEQVEYVSSVGTTFSLPARLREAPGGDPVFFFLAAVAVTVRCRANLRNQSADS